MDNNCDTIWKKKIVFSDGLEHYYAQQNSRIKLV